MYPNFEGKVSYSQAGTEQKSVWFSKKILGMMRWQKIDLHKKLSKMIIPNSFLYARGRRDYVDTQRTASLETLIEWMRRDLYWQ